MADIHFNSSKLPTSAILGMMRKLRALMQLLPSVSIGYYVSFVEQIEHLIHLTQYWTKFCDTCMTYVFNIYNVRDKSYYCNEIKTTISGQL